MPELGYTLIGEEHGPNDLVETAARAEAAGFSFALASDHFHPWTSTQGNSPFVWSTLGGIARETSSLRVGTGVTCPLFRIHPANVAQAAATVATMMPDRFFLGVGTGENLNEHVLGHHWPPHDVRLERLEEAVDIIRSLWTGEEYSHHGEYYTVENARLYTVPDGEIPIDVAASGPRTAEVAGRVGDGLISTAPDESVVDRFEAASDEASGTSRTSDWSGDDGEAESDGGEASGASQSTSERRSDDDRPTYGQVTVCWAETEAEARRTAHEHWPNVALSGELGQVLPTPAHFEQAAEMVSEEDVAELVVCGPDADDHVEMIQQFVDAGFDHVTVHQVGPQQEAAIEFYEEEVIPSFR